MRLMPLFLLVISLFLPANGCLAAEPPDPENTEAETVEEQKEEPAGPKPWYKNIVPVPVIITEPAIGQGLGIGIGYFHPAKLPETSSLGPVETPETVINANQAPKPPPTVTGVFGGATSNGTWAAGVGHMNTFRNDTIRFLGAAGYANVITDFYVLDQPFEFNLEGVIVYQDVRFRLGKSNWFMGVALSYLDATNTFKFKPPESVGVDIDGFFATDFKDVGLKGRLMYDSRDDSMMPGKGRLFDLSVTRNDQGLGGDYDYTTTELKFLSFHSLNDRFVIGVRAEYATVDGDPPFFAIPWVTMRGIPAMRFQGRNVTTAEVEGRYNFSSNWAMIAFYGRGWTDIYKPDLDTEFKIRAYGTGIRWKALKEQGVWVGLDLAKGPEDTVYYVQVGHPW